VGGATPADSEDFYQKRFCKKDCRMKDEQRDDDCVLLEDLQEGSDFASSAAEIIACPDVLGLFAKDWRRGVAGEVMNAKMLYLVATSRLLDRTMHAAIKGPSSGGKSEIRARLLAFFPPESVIAFTSLSEKTLLYHDGDFSHKILSMAEATAADEQSFQDYLLRELMSEGRLRHWTVQKNAKNKMVSHLIEKNGPVSFMVTTTKTKLHPENETRMLSLEVDDSEGQTKAVLKKVAAVEGLGDQATLLDYSRWHDFQRWLEDGPRSVVIPFAGDLALAIPARSVRLRRDFGQVLRAIQAHALLHRSHRQTDDEGRIVADLEADYRPVRELMRALLAKNAGVGVKPAIAETIAVVAELTADMPADQGVQADKVAKKLKMDKSAGSRRLRDAAGEGFVVNLETKRGQPGKWRLTGQTVESEEMLPDPTALASENTRNRATGGQKPSQEKELAVAYPHATGLQPDATGPSDERTRATGCNRQRNRQIYEEYGESASGCAVARDLGGRWRRWRPIRRPPRPLTQPMGRPRDTHRA
jgi:hypothetical protein